MHHVKRPIQHLNMLQVHVASCLLNQQAALLRQGITSCAATFSKQQSLNPLHPVDNYKSPHPAAHPAAVSTLTLLSSIQSPKTPLHLSANTQASKCLHTGGVPSPMLTPPNTHSKASVFSASAPSLFLVVEGGVYVGTAGSGCANGNAAKAKAGHVQFHARRRTS